MLPYLHSPFQRVHNKSHFREAIIRLCILNQPIKLRHRTGLDRIHDIDIGFHGLVVGMTGPFHHDVRGDAEGEGVDDEGTAARMGADELPLGLDLVGSDVALVGGDANLLIDTSEFAQLLDVAVHRLVGVVRKGLVVLERSILVFLQDGFGDLVQFDGDAVRRLDCRDLDVVALDVAAAEVVDVGVPEAGETTEQENVTDGIQVGQGLGEFQVPDTGNLFLGQVDNLALRHLQGRMEFLIVQVGVVAPVGRPVQEPAEIAQLLFDGGILQANQILLIIILSFSLLFPGSAKLLAVAHIRDEFRQGGFRQVGELDVLLESGQIDTHRLHLLEGSFRPGVLFAAFFQEHIIGLEEIRLFWLAFLLRLRSRSLRDSTVQTGLVPFLNLLLGRNDIVTLEKLEGRFHLLPTIPERGVDLKCGLSSRALIVRFDKLVLFVPGRKVFYLTTGRGNQTEAVERNVLLDLIGSFSLPVGAEFEGDSVLEVHNSFTFEITKCDKSVTNF